MKKSVYLKGLESIAKEGWRDSSQDWAFHERPGIISMFCFACSRLEQMPAGQIQRAFGMARGRSLLSDAVSKVFNRHAHVIAKPKRKPKRTAEVLFNGNLALQGLELDL